MASSYCSVDDVTEISGVNQTYFFRNSQTAETDFNELIGKWIELASGTINTYCNRTFSPEDVPETIRLATILMVCNLIGFVQSRKETPIIKKDDWTVDFLDVKIFTDDIKEMLEPYEKSRRATSKIQIYTISGDKFGES